MNPFNVHSVYIGLLIVLDYISYWKVSGEAQETSYTSVPAASMTSTAYPIDMQDAYTIQQLAVIIDALENLNILDGKKQKCYMLDRITKLTEQVDSRTQKIALAFYVSQPLLHVDGEDFNSSAKDSLVQEGTVTQSGVNDRKSESACGDEEFLTGFQAGDGGGKEGNNMETGVTADSIKDQNETSNKTVAQQESGDAATGNEQDNNLRGKLSHTQIMVISTCSTVIGLFFIVALIMRIRNYLKRKTESSGKQRRHLGSSSMAFRSSSHSPARTDSIVSKCGFPDSTTNLPVHNTQMNGSFPKNTTSTLVAPDNKPLLVITSASAPSSPLIHSAFGQPYKNKVTHTPSAPAGTSSKDYLSIHNTKYHRATTQKSTEITNNNHTPLTRNPQQHRDMHSNHIATLSNHTVPLSNHIATFSNQSTPSYTKGSHTSFSLHFNEYFRDSSKASSVSSIVSADNKQIADTALNQSKHQNESSKKQSASESSENSTDSTPQLGDTETEELTNAAGDINTPSRCQSDDVFDELSVSSDQDGVQLPSSILTTRNEAQESKNEQEQLGGLSPREKRSSSSSSYGRKSVSFSIDIEQKQSLSSDLEESPDEETRQDENSLLLRPEFLGMEPTYV